MALVFIVEDDNDIRQIEAYALKCGGFEIEEFEDAKALYERLEKKTPDLFLLDVMLPDEDGLSILRKIREKRETKRIPVIMVTAKTTEIDKVKGLDNGADDYMTKPFNILEVKARIKAIKRRNRHIATADPSTRIVAGNMVMDRNNRHVYIKGKEISLTTKEYDVLELLVTNPNKVYGREMLLSLIWGYDYPGDARTVDVHIRRLREKIESNPSEPEYVHTKWGMGYFFKQ